MQLIHLLSYETYNSKKRLTFKSKSFRFKTYFFIILVKNIKHIHKISKTFNTYGLPKLSINFNAIGEIYLSFTHIAAI